MKKAKSSQQTLLTSFLKPKHLKNNTDVYVSSQESLDSGNVSDYIPETQQITCNRPLRRVIRRVKNGSSGKEGLKVNIRTESKEKYGSSPSKNCKKSTLKESPTKVSSRLVAWLSPKKKLTINDEKIIDDISNRLNSFNNKEEIDVSAKKSEDEVVLRRSPRKHQSSYELDRVTSKSTLKENHRLPELVEPIYLDETDDALFANYKSPVKFEGDNKKHFRTSSEDLSQLVHKRKRLDFTHDGTTLEADLLQKSNQGLAEDGPLQATSELFNSTSNDGVDLSQGRRCRVVGIQSTIEGNLLLTLLCLRTNNQTQCTLHYPWNGLSISVGDLVSVKALKSSNSKNTWYVNERGANWFVLHSDVLISCTSVVGFLFCKRRSILGHFFKELPSASQATAMNIGIIVHQIFQQALNKRLNEAEIKKLFDEVLCSQELLKNAYLQGMDIDKIKETTLTYLPRIINFINDFTSFNSEANNSSAPGNEWPGKITAIKDIEENVWIPQFGLKGRIDATVEVKIHSKRKIMPLELKTGKTSNSAEHRGQVILYCMMLSELGTDVDSGLLLYLKDAVMKEVKGGDVERRDLIMLRNELVSRTQEAYASSQVDGSISLPDPIDRKSVCLSCPQLIACTSALRKCGDNSHSISTLVAEKTSHLSDKHLDYVFKWLRLISLEVKQSKQLSPIWANSIDNREEEGTCLSDLIITGDAIPGELKTKLTFTRDKPLKQDVFEEGQYVIVSSNSQVAIACGHVQSLSLSHITLLLDRDLRTFLPPFHIDRYESGSSANLMSSFLSILLDNSPKAAILRKLIIDKELPIFVGKLSSKIKVKCHKIFAEINRDQVRALLQVLSADSYIIVNGMPGTGKSRTVVALIEVLTLLGHSILVTSHTHSAVDNILMKLPQYLHGGILRIGSNKRVHSSIIHLTENSLLAEQPVMTSDQIAAFYSSKSIIGVTCLAASHQLLAKKEFDYCIVDEASQVCQPEILGALASSKKFVLIGDPNQLPPLVISEKAKELGMGESLLESLDRPAVTTQLTIQYRMNQVITSLANAVTYKNLLKCANDDIALSTIKPIRQLDEATPEWLKRVCSSCLSDSIIVIDISISDQINQNVNKAEAKIIQTSLCAFKQLGIDADVGIMSPYRAQVSYIESLIKESYKETEVSTVDTYQGRDKPIIFYSATRNKPKVEGTNDILGDKSRLTVAITRAKHKLVIIGNVEALNSYPTFNSLLSHIDKSKIIKVKPEDVPDANTI